MKKGAHTQGESSGTETDCVPGGRRKKSRNGREAFLEEMGPRAELRSIRRIC